MSLFFAIMGFENLLDIEQNYRHYFYFHRRIFSDYEQSNHEDGNLSTTYDYYSGLFGTFSGNGNDASYDGQVHLTYNTSVENTGYFAMNSYAKFIRCLLQ